MKLQDRALMPHVEGYIQLIEVESGSAELEVCTRVHQAAAPSAGRIRYTRHPVHEQLARAASNGRLRNIPVRVLFDQPEHNLHVRYQAWSNGYEHGPSCVGNGETASRLDPAWMAWNSTRCMGPNLCAAVRKRTLDCALDVRLRVTIDGQSDPIRTWVVRTKSENSYQSLMGALVHLKAMFGGLRQLPLDLSVYQMSTRASGFLPFACINLGLRDGTTINDAIAIQKDPHMGMEALGAAALESWNELLTGPSEGTESQAATSPGSEGEVPSIVDTTDSLLFSSAIEAARSVELRRKSQSTQ